MNTERIVDSLNFLEMGKTGGAVILTKNGEVASTTVLSDSKLKVAEKTVLKDENHYQTVKDPADGKGYLLIGVLSDVASIKYRVMIPEKEILQNLPFFQMAAYIVPLGGILFLIFYLILLRQLLLKPMKILIQGMNRITRGDLNIRLNDKHSSEFSFLIGTDRKSVVWERV